MDLNGLKDRRVDRACASTEQKHLIALVRVVVVITVENYNQLANAADQAHKP